MIHLIAEKQHVYHRIVQTATGSQIRQKKLSIVFRVRSWLPGYGVTARFRPSSLFTVQCSAWSSSGPAASTIRPARDI